MSDTATPAAAATRDAARCNRCGQNHPRHPTDPAHVEVHPIQWTGGYGSTFPGDLMRVTLAQGGGPSISQAGYVHARYTVVRVMADRDKAEEMVERLNLDRRGLSVYMLSEIEQ